MTKTTPPIQRSGKQLPAPAVPTLLAMLFAVIGTSALQAQPAKPPSGSNDRTCSSKDLANAVILSPKDTGEVLEGPICVGVIVNVLRYSVEFGRSITFSPGPDLVKGFSPPTTTPGGAAKTLADVTSGLTVIRTTWRVRDGMNLAAAGKVAKAVADLKALVSASDDIFRTNGAAAVVRAKDAPALQAEIRDALSATWLPADDIFRSFQDLHDGATSLLLSGPTPADKTMITDTLAEITALMAEVEHSTTAGDRTADFNKQKSIVQFWDRLFADLTEKSFMKTTYVSCGVSFNQNKQIAIKLIEFDRLPVFDVQSPSSVDLKDPFVAVNCASPFSLSAGVELRFLGNQAFGLVPSGTTGATQFNVIDDEKTLPLAMGMVHVRLKEWLNHRVGMHASFGVAAHVTGSEAGGSGAEYLSGLSLSLFRTVYITPGWHIGKVAALGGGYKIGDPVPTGVTVVPVKSSYEHGFGLAFTFGKPN